MISGPQSHDGAAGKFFGDFSPAPSIAEKTRLFIQLLYSAPLAREVRARLGEGTLSNEWRSFLDTIDFDHVRVEQRVRVTDMLAQFRNTTPSLYACLRQETFEALVSAFCDAPMLWQPKGRDLNEHFCLFAVEELRETDEFAAAAARLDGVISGMETSPEMPTPWPQHVKTPGTRRELLVVEHAVLDVDASPMTAENAPRLRQLRKEPEIIVVRAEANSGVTLQCLPLPSGKVEEALQ